MYLSFTDPCGGCISSFESTNSVDTADMIAVKLQKRRIQTQCSYRMTGSALKPSLSARKGHSFCSVSPLKGFYSSTAYPNEVEAFLRTLFPRTAWKSFLQSFPKGITHQLLTEVYTYTYSPNSYKNSEGRHFYSPLCKYRLCFRGLSIPDDNNKSRQAFAITQTPSRHLIYIQFSGHVYHISQVSFTIV